MPRTDSDPLLPAEQEASFFPPRTPGTSSTPNDSSLHTPTDGDLQHNESTTSSVQASHSHAGTLSMAFSSSQQPSHLSPTPVSYHPLGSKFIPHLSSKPLCMLPILGARLVLVGTADGLYVLDPSQAGGARARCLWTGVGVRELRVVGVEKDDAGGTRTPRGGVVGVTCKDEDEEGGDGEVRVWQLGSLVSLARWVASQEVGPLERLLASPRS
jgi:hypothetical protein